MQGKRQGKFAIFTIEKTTDCSVFFDYFHISIKKQRQLFQQGKILLNQQVIHQPQPLNRNDKLALQVFEPMEIDYAPQGSCNVVYEDDCILIVNKPPFLIIHEDCKDKLNTLNNQVAAYYQQTRQNIAVRPIHRLDYETSGLVIYSKCPFFQPFFDYCLSEKKIQRSYYALVKGRLAQKKPFTIDQPIGKDRHVNNKYRVSKTGKPAQTIVTVMQSNPSFSLIRCDLKTGRTHQIRVHLAYLNHPLLSDPIYGSKDPRIPRCGLQAYLIRWIDPLTQSYKQVEIPLDHDMAKVIR